MSSKKPENGLPHNQDDAEKQRSPGHGRAEDSRFADFSMPFETRHDATVSYHESPGSKAQSKPDENPLDVTATFVSPSRSEQTLALYEMEFFEGRTPKRIGPYEIVSVLGEGGMGTVYLANQTMPVRRRVALKLLKRGMDKPDMLARFERERHSLALMNHPNIAVVHDAGATDRHQPFLVMEYLDGLPLTTYCNQNALDIEERLRLFLVVCQAIQHAHQKMVIHRDLKPSNVMVVIRDGVPVPKVIDFGLAKALDASDDDTTRVTENAGPLGTPQYMSPEQIDGNELDTRADVYALGVLLYELLVGVKPFQLDRNDFYSMLFKILREEPDPPHLRYQKLERPRQSDIANERKMSRETLTQTLRGDLGWVMGKAMEKDRNLRYGSVADLSADIRHFLNHEPLSVANKTAGYRLKKFVRRNKMPVLISLGLAALLIFGIIGTTFGMIKANQAMRIAQQEERKARSSIDYLLRMLESANPENDGQNVRVLDLLDQASASISQDLGNLPEVEATIRNTIGTTYLELGQYDDAELHLRKAAEIRGRVLGEDSEDTMKTVNSVGRVLYKKGLYAEAEELHRNVLEKEIKLLGHDHPTTLWSMYNLGKSLEKQGRLKEAEKIFRENVNAREKVLGPGHPHLLISVNSLSSVLSTLGHLEEAEDLLRRNLEGFRVTLGENHPDTLNAIDYLGSVLNRMGRPEEGEPLIRHALERRMQVFGGDHPKTLSSYNNLAWVLTSLNKHEEAAFYNRKAFEAKKQVLGPEHPSTRRSLLNLAHSLYHMARYEEAQPLYLQALELLTRTQPQNKALIAIYQGNSGKSLIALNRFEEAESMLLAGHAVLKDERDFSREHQTLLQNMVVLYKKWGKPEEARRYESMLDPAEM